MRKQVTSTRRYDYLPPTKYLTIEQINRLRRHTQVEAKRARDRGTKRGIVNWMLIELLLETGLRAEELCQLQMRDLPTYHGKDQVLVRQGKGDVLRVIDVKSSLKQKLCEFIKTCRPGAKPGSAVFASDSGYRLIYQKVWRNGKVTIRKEYSARLIYQSLYNKIKRIGKRAGISHLHPHMFRHTFAVHLHAVEHDLRLVQDQLGHSKPDTSARYARVLDEDRRRQIERLYAESV